MRMQFQFLRMIILLAGGLLALSPGAAGPLARPTGPVILTVTGAITETNAPGKAEFDLAMLEALGLDEVQTTTNWTDGQQLFEGVLARKVLDAVGAAGGTAEVAALNDYHATIPIADFRDYPVLFALRMNGTPMTPRDKGPIWIVYPRDDYPALKVANYDLRWVWQLKSVDIK